MVNIKNIYQCIINYKINCSKKDKHLIKLQTKYNNAIKKIESSEISVYDKNLQKEQLLNKHNLILLNIDKKYSLKTETVNARHTVNTTKLILNKQYELDTKLAPKINSITKKYETKKQAKTEPYNALKTKIKTPYDKPIQKMKSKLDKYETKKIAITIGAIGTTISPEQFANNTKLKLYLNQLQTDMIQTEIIRQKIKKLKEPNINTEKNAANNKRVKTIKQILNNSINNG